MALQASSMRTLLPELYSPAVPKAVYFISTWSILLKRVDFVSDIECNNVWVLFLVVLGLLWESGQSCSLLVVFGRGGERVDCEPIYDDLEWFPRHREMQIASCAVRPPMWESKFRTSKEWSAHMV